MGSTVSAPAVPNPLLLPEKTARVAKVVGESLRNPQKWAELARVVSYVRYERRLTLKEFAGLLDRSESQIRAWETASERPQIEALWAVEVFREDLIYGLAKEAGIEVERTIHLRRQG
jgi:hypothetical protein